MNDKRNIIVMFLFVMLSFAIISEVSAVSEAEADGTGFNPSMKSVNMTDHDFAGESNMQDHKNDFEDEIKFHNEQNSINTPQNNLGDKNIENENLYEHDLVNNKPDNLPIGPQGNDGNNFDGERDNLSKIPTDINGQMDNLSNMNPQDNPDHELRNDNFTAVPKGEAIDDVVSNLIGLNNISPNFKKDDKNMPKDSDNKYPMDKNESALVKFDEKNSSAKLPDNMKNPKDIKKVKKSNQKKSKKLKKYKKIKKPSKKSKKKVVKR